MLEWGGSFSADRSSFSRWVLGWHLLGLPYLLLCTTRTRSSFSSLGGAEDSWGDWCPQGGEAVGSWQASQVHLRRVSHPSWVGRFLCWSRAQRSRSGAMERPRMRTAHPSGLHCPGGAQTWEFEFCRDLRFACYGEAAWTFAGCPYWCFEWGQVNWCYAWRRRRDPGPLSLFWQWSGGGSPGWHGGRLESKDASWWLTSLRLSMSSWRSMTLRLTILQTSKVFLWTMRGLYGWLGGSCEGVGCCSRDGTCPFLLGSRGAGSSEIKSSWSQSEESHEGQDHQPGTDGSFRGSVGSGSITTESGCNDHCSRCKRRRSSKSSSRCRGCRRAAAWTCRSKDAKADRHAGCRNSEWPSKGGVSASPKKSSRISVRRRTLRSHFFRSSGFRRSPSGGLWLPWLPIFLQEEIRCWNWVEAMPGAPLRQQEVMARREKMISDLSSGSSTFFFQMLQQMHRRLHPSRPAPKNDSEVRASGLSMLAYMERMGGFKNQRETGLILWILGHAIDDLIAGQVHMAQEHLALLVVSLEQNALDKGDWNIPFLLALVEEPPVQVFQDRVSTVSRYGRPFAPLVPAQWAAIAWDTWKTWRFWTTRRTKRHRLQGRRLEKRERSLPPRRSRGSPEKRRGKSRSHSECMCCPWGARWFARRGTHDSWNSWGWRRSKWPPSYGLWGLEEGRQEAGHLFLWAWISLLVFEAFGQCAEVEMPLVWIHCSLHSTTTRWVCCGSDYVSYTLSSVFGRMPSGLSARRRRRWHLQRAVHVICMALTSGTTMASLELRIWGRFLQKFTSGFTRG